jgi:sugar phosphate isomerase/epimerase
MFKNLSPSALGVTGHQSEIIELALTYGFRGMDLDVVDFATRARHRGMPYARRLIDSAKVRLGSFSLPMDWEADDEEFKKQLEKLPEYAQAAAEVGCTRCTAVLVPAGDQRPYHENFEFHRHRFTEICKALEPSGVRLGLGFHAAEYLRKDTAFQFIHDFDALTLLMNMIGAPNVGLLIDVWDMVASGQSIETIGKLPLGQVIAVRVSQLPADVPTAELDKNSRRLPDAEDGRIDLAAALRILSEMGYDGPVSPNPARGAFGSRRRDAIVRQAGESLEKVWVEAGLPGESRAAAPSASPTPASPSEGS